VTEENSRLAIRASFKNSKRKLILQEVIIIQHEFQPDSLFVKYTESISKAISQQKNQNLSNIIGARVLFNYPINDEVLDFS